MGHINLGEENYCLKCLKCDRWKYSGGVKPFVWVCHLDPHRLTSSLKQQTPVTVTNSSMRGMVGMMM